ncbi:MAG: nitrous oxide-stimulated promoter family protein [Verrucomicrobia bacterium]|nr:MAG: nitrous oxide-stimulated promoter family protein [Verrucomicrobiota bacterium]
MQRLEREQRTVAAMIRLYCHAHHHAPELCAECSALLAYAQLRLLRCPFQENKPVCADCRVHCYQPRRRTEIQEIMRYAGPRMLWHHPLLALGHLLDGWRRQQ